MNKKQGREKSKWRNTGIPYFEIEAWMETGYTPRAAKNLYEAGVSLEEARKSLPSGHSKPNEQH